MPTVNILYSVDLLSIPFITKPEALLEYRRRYLHILD